MKKIHPLKQHMVDLEILISVKQIEALILLLDSLFKMDRVVVNYQVELKDNFNRCKINRCIKKKTHPMDLIQLSKDFLI